MIFMIKRFCVMISVVILVAISAGCVQSTAPISSSDASISSDMQSSQASQEPDQLQPSENQESSIPNESTESEAHTFIDALQENRKNCSIISGIIFEGTEGLLSIRTADGQELEFDAGGAAIVYIQGLRFGDPVTIYYTGTIDGTDTTNVVVKELVQP